MLKAIVRDGVIVPMEPLPADFVEGMEIEIRVSPRRSRTPEEIRAWGAQLDALCSSSTPEDEAIIQAAINEERASAKARARRERLGDE